MVHQFKFWGSGHDFLSGINRILSNSSAVDINRTTLNNYTNKDIAKVIDIDRYMYQANTMFSLV